MNDGEYTLIILTCRDATESNYDVVWFSNRDESCVKSIFTLLPLKVVFNEKTLIYYLQQNYNNSLLIFF